MLPDPHEVARVMLAYPEATQAAAELWIAEAVLAHRLECPDLIELALKLGEGF